MPTACAWTRGVDCRSQNLKQIVIKKVGSTFLFLESAILRSSVPDLGQVPENLTFNCPRIFSDTIQIPWHSFHCELMGTASNCNGRGSAQVIDLFQPTIVSTLLSIEVIASYLLLIEKDQKLEMAQYGLAY